MGYVNTDNSKELESTFKNWTFQCDPMERRFEETGGNLKLNPLDRDQIQGDHTDISVMSDETNETCSYSHRTDPSSETPRSFENFPKHITDIRDVGKGSSCNLYALIDCILHTNGWFSH